MTKYFKVYFSTFVLLILNSNRHIISLHSVNYEHLKFFYNLANFLFWNNFTQINFTLVVIPVEPHPLFFKKTENKQERGLPSDSRLQFSRLMVNKVTLLELHLTKEISVPKPFLKK